MFCHEKSFATPVGSTDLSSIENPKFVENAPAHVLAENKERLTQWIAEAERVAKAIDRLDEMI